MEMRSNVPRYLIRIIAGCYVVYLGAKNLYNMYKEYSAGTLDLNITIAIVSALFVVIGLYIAIVSYFGYKKVKQEEIEEAERQARLDALRPKESVETVESYEPKEDED